MKLALLLLGLFIMVEASRVRFLAFIMEGAQLGTGVRFLPSDWFHPSKVPRRVAI
jgi:hypothetical protein